MNEQLLKAITRLFAIVAKERVTIDEKKKIEEFLFDHIDKSEISKYLEIFDEFSQKSSKEVLEPKELDPETEEFVEDWANIVLICKHINMELTEYQKVVMLLKIIELMYVDEVFSERQSNLLYYISKLVKVENSDVEQLTNFVTKNEISELSNRHVLIVDDGSEGEYFDCMHMAIRNLTGYLAVLYLPKIETYLLKYVGISPIRLNGIPVRSRSISVFPAGSNIRGDKIEPIYYSDVVSRFNVLEEHRKLVFQARNVSYKFKNGKIGLRNINLCEQSGQLVGVMGASGSGKSSLFEVLSGKRTPVLGEVKINGVDIHKNPGAIQGLIGYVPQDDLLIEDLSVHENLYFAAKLCFDGKSEKSLNEIVNKALLSLGLNDIKDLKVGSPLNKTISGGQRKRLNIGLELLREPSIIFLDEPTSGLSSRDSENIMDLLKELSLKGKMVFSIIHQPSSDIFKMFDSLVILDVGGYQIYYGNPVEAVAYFKEIINLVNRDQGACITCGNVKVEQIFSIIETRVVDEYGRFTERRKISAKEWNDYFLKKNKVSYPDTNISIPEVENFKIPSRVDQFKVFCKRDVLAKLSNKQYLIINLLEAPVLGFILAYFIRYRGQGVEYEFFKNSNIPAYFFMSIIVALFMGLTVSAEEIIKDKKILEREKFLHLSRSSYLASKLIIMFSVSAIQTFSFVAIGDVLLNFQGMHFYYWMVLFTCSCASNVVGLNISSAFNSAVTIYILIPIILIPQLIFSGVVFSFDKLNPDLGSQENVPWYGEMMTSRWAFEGAMVKQYVDNKYNAQFYEYDKVIADTEYKMAYLIPTLLTQLEALPADQPQHWNENNFLVLKNEIGKELATFGSDKFQQLSFLNEIEFDSSVYAETKKFLETIKKVYIRRYDKAITEKEDYVQNILNRNNGLTSLENQRKKYHNEQIEIMVRNSNASERIIVADGHVIRKIDPIYFDPPKPKIPIDFRTYFYAPTKYLFGFNIPTPGFNLLVIWLMSAMLIVALYLDVLRSIIWRFEHMVIKPTPYYNRKNKKYIVNRWARKK